MPDSDDDIQFQSFDNYFTGLPAATLPIGSSPMLVFEGGTTKQVPASSVGGRKLLTANTVFNYSLAGSDLTGDGSAGNPWATPQHAANVIGQTIDAAGFVVTVLGAPGTYQGATCTGYPLNCPQYIFSGTVGNFSNVKWTESVLSGFSCFDTFLSGSPLIILQWMTLEPQTAGDTCAAFNEPTVQINVLNCSLVAPVGGGGDAIGIFGPFCSLSASGISISGTWGDLVGCYGLNGSIFVNATTLVSTPAFSNGIVNVGTDGAESFVSMVNNLSGSMSGPLLTAISPCTIASDSSWTGATAPVLTSLNIVFNGDLSALKIAGLPTTANLPNDQTYGVFKDTSGGGVYVAYNDSGTIKKVALT